MVLLLALSLAYTGPLQRTPQPSVVIQCDEVEINTVQDWNEEGTSWKPRFVQLIAWRQYDGPRIGGYGRCAKHYDGGRHVVTYVLIDPATLRLRNHRRMVAVRAKCSGGGKLVEYRAWRYKRTVTSNDPEIDDREFWPLAVRDKE